MRITERFQDPRFETNFRLSVEGRGKHIIIEKEEDLSIHIDADQLGTLIGMLQALQRRVEGK